jgi:hypothetical protein
MKENTLNIGGQRHTVGWLTKFPFPIFVIISLRSSMSLMVDIWTPFYVENDILKA